MPHKRDHVARRAAPAAIEKLLFRGEAETVAAAATQTSSGPFGGPDTLQHRAMLERDVEDIRLAGCLD
jgi:hypothetical protein